MTRGRPRNFDRNAALQQAMELFWERGYGNTSLSDLGKALRLASPSIYAAFGSKEQLFQEALDHYGRHEGRRIWSDVETALSAKDALTAFLTNSARLFSRGDHPPGCMVVLAALDARQDLAVSWKLKDIRRANVGRLAALLRRAATKAELADDTDYDILARFYVTVQQGMSIQARDGASEEELMEVAREALRAWPSGPPTN